jgi:hypothetical protein
MKKLAIIALLAIAASAFAQPQTPPAGYCEVTVCNRIERFSLDPFSHLKDRWGESCSPGLLAKKDAVVGKELSSDSRWYQGSTINPTKKSVTRVKSVGKCG